jgi:uncharacterized membrane protein
MSLPIVSLSGSFTLASATVFAPLSLSVVGLAIAVLLAVLAAGFIARQAIDQDARRRPHLRLVPTANAWRYSDHSTLDESAVGL